jgi:putative glycosyltransferase
MKLSIVTTLFKSTEHIQEFYTRISIEAQKITQDYEIIFVDDGSPDNSLHKAVALFETDNRVKVIELSRNFGHHKAAMTGLSHAKGDYIFFIDSDLEEEPELLGIFWAELKKNIDMDVIYGVQENRKGGWFEKISGDIFYKIFNKISDIKITRNLVAARLTTKNYNQALILHKERNLFLAGLWSLTGFKQKPVLVKKNFKAKTTYVFGKKVSLFIESITSFSIFPLKFMLYIGFFISFLSFLFIFWIFFKKFFFNIGIEGWSSLIVSIWFIGGVIIMFLGIIGIYISKIFNETKQRPYTIIRKKYEKDIN